MEEVVNVKTKQKHKYFILAQGSNYVRHFHGIQQSKTPVIYGVEGNMHVT